jgi:DNA-binding HxlR family transcriptional regulator
VNRTLMRLEEDGLISRTKRIITIHDWTKLAKTADFQPRYLHLQAAGQEPGRHVRA